MKNAEDFLATEQTLAAGGRDYIYFSLSRAAETIGDISRLPVSLKILLENLLRHGVSADVARAVSQSVRTAAYDVPIAFYPARILSQDLAGVPLVVDLASLRDAVAHAGGDAARVNPVIPVDFVVDHSISVDHSGSAESLSRNAALEFARNEERFRFLKWAQGEFRNFRLIPPGKGICHQVNLEYLSKIVWTSTDSKGRAVAYCDTVLGTDSHTTMVNGIGVLGWGTGGIEAELAMLGQPVSMTIPEVVGVRLSGAPAPGILATDIVLTVTQVLRREGVVGKFVEFFGDGIASLAATDRATIANMAPDYGATCGFFPVDLETLRYLEMSGRSASGIALVEAYTKAQGIWSGPETPEPAFARVVEIDLGLIETSLAGPKRPQERRSLRQVAPDFRREFPRAPDSQNSRDAALAVQDGDVTIAAITSCTNTSNPHAMITAGLLARNARACGLERKPWVKTSFAPGSQVVSDYLAASGLQPFLDELGFNIVGYGCTTCIGNSGPLAPNISDAIASADVVTAAVSSGNRNFEGRIHPLVKASYLASPPLVVAYALAGSVLTDLTVEPLGKSRDGRDVYLEDLWPAGKEVDACVQTFVQPSEFKTRYREIFTGTENWEALREDSGARYRWSDSSTFISNPPYFEDTSPSASIRGARVLLVVGDSFTTDHISPAGTILPGSPAGRFLDKKGVRREDFGSYGTRRGNHDVMVRGTFANIRIRNELLPGVEGGYARHVPSQRVMSVFDAAMAYREERTPLIVIGGREYGTGSSRDWAAKGTSLLGIRAVIAESFERIHRANLVGMSVLPLQLIVPDSRAALGLDGFELFDFPDLEDIAPNREIEGVITNRDGVRRTIRVRMCIETETECAYFNAGGLLKYARDMFSG